MPATARGGPAPGLLSTVAGAVIGLAAKVLLPVLESRDDAFAEFVEMRLPPVLAGLVLAAALAAVMSISSGALIATATVFSQDIVARMHHRDIEAGSEHDHSATTGSTSPASASSWWSSRACSKTSSTR